MTDLTKGIIKIDGFTIKPNTTLKEMQNFFGDRARVLELSTGPRLKLQRPYYLSENIYAYNFDFDKTGVIKTFALVPNVPEELKGNPTAVAKYMLQVSKQWLKETINEAPHTLNDSCVYYKFQAVDYFASISKDLHYGLIGGEINITFHEA